jgi:NAD(P)-dependent dehydrogenase (short-subunit alcohol dehydrogenase family)
MALAAEGARVMIGDIADAGSLVGEIAAKHGTDSAASAHLDVTDETSVKAFVDEALARFGKIDVLVNNAALFAALQDQKLTDIDVELWDRVMAVNIRGLFLVCKHVLPHMLAQGSGKIINIGSAAAFRGIPGMVHYVTSKGAVTAFTRALSREVGPHGICVNTLAPGFTLSDTVVEHNPGHVANARDLAIQRRAIKRDGYPEDLLGSLIFLATPDSDFLTGQTIAVDGGAVNT